MSQQGDDFAATYGHEADVVAAATGIDRWALLTQWAVETAFGAAVNNLNNLGNIRCIQSAPCVGGFAQFPDLRSFAFAAVATWHNGYYQAVLDAAGKPLADQLRAIGESPWDAGHYDNGGGPGSSLLAAVGEFSMASNPSSNDTAELLAAIQAAHAELTAATNEIVRQVGELTAKVETDMGNLWSGNGWPALDAVRADIAALKAAVGAATPAAGVPPAGQACPVCGGTKVVVVGTSGGLAYKPCSNCGGTGQAPAPAAPSEPPAPVVS